MDPRSELNLEHVHPDLVKVIRLTDLRHQSAFVVIQGLRTLAQEKTNVATGHSETLHSRHLPNKDGVACAVDVMATPNGHPSWDAEAYKPIATMIEAVGTYLYIPIEWGGDWTTLKDWGHFQLPWKEYP